MCHEWQKIVKIKNFLRKDEELDSPRIQTSPLERVTNSSTSRNTSGNFGNLCDLDFISLQNKELMNILEELPNRTQVSGDNITAFTRSSHLKGHFLWYWDKNTWKRFRICSYSKENKSTRVIKRFQNFFVFWWESNVIFEMSVVYVLEIH